MRSFTDLCGSSPNYLKKIMANQSMFRGNWYITNSLISENDTPIISDDSSKEYFNLIDSINSKRHIKNAFFFFDGQSGNLLHEFYSRRVAAISLKMAEKTIEKYIDSGIIYNDYIISRHRVLIH